MGASFRYVDSKNFDDNYVYSLSYMLKNYQPYDGLNFSRGFRTPSIKELYYNWYGHSPAIIETLIYYQQLMIIFHFQFKIRYR